MSKPIIGITTGQRFIPATTLYREEKVISSPIEYFRAVIRSGGSPIFLPPTGDHAAIETAMECFDGLLLSGGGDVDAGRYGEAQHETSGKPQEARDDTELTATRIALERGMPILAICRGIQVLNIALGGNLVQDIPSQVADALVHRTPPAEPHAFHELSVSSDSLLARVLGVQAGTVNSSHHQSANRLGEGLRVCARARDGVIEALEADDGGPVLAVQWHPERTYEEDALSRKLFDWFVAEAGTRGRSQAE